MDRRENFNLLALVLHIQIRTLSTTCAIGLKIACQTTILKMQRQKKCYLRYRNFKSEFSNSGLSRPEHTNKSIASYKVIKRTVYHSTKWSMSAGKWDALSMEHWYLYPLRPAWLLRLRFSVGTVGTGWSSWCLWWWSLWSRCSGCAVHNLQLDHDSQCKSQAREGTTGVFMGVAWRGPSKDDWNLPGRAQEDNFEDGWPSWVIARRCKDSKTNCMRRLVWPNFAHRNLRLKPRKIIARLKSAGEDTLTQREIITDNLLLGESKSFWNLSITAHASVCRHETANSKFMISEIMSVVCSDSRKTGMKSEKELVKANHLFQGAGISCSKAIFKVSNIWTRKRRGQEAEFQKRVRNFNIKIEKKRACLQRGGSFRSFVLHCPSVLKNLNWPGKIERLSSNTSEIYKQNPGHAAGLPGMAHD